MVRHNKSNRRVLRLRKSHTLRESSSEDELVTFFSDSYKSNHEEKLFSENINDHGLDKAPIIIGSGIVLTEKQMEHLANNDYEYNAAAGSVLEKLFMQRFWCWLTKFVPLCIMPCTITAIGFLLNLITSSILIYYSPSATNIVPTWTLYLAAIGVFLYQTADALDGKQCYKIQNSQIEEFYDHACDSVSTILLMYSVAISTNCGQYPTLLIVLIYFSLVAFWSTHWQCYITNQMIFGNVDVTEAQFVMMITHLCSAVFGQQIWSIELFHIKGFILQTNQLLALVTLLTLFRSIWHNCCIVLFDCKTPLEIFGALQFKRRTDTLRPLVPIVLLTLLSLSNWYFLSKPRNHYKIIEETFILVTFVVMFGTSIAKLTMRLVLDHCTNDNAQIVDIALIPSVIFLLVQLTPLYVYTFNILILTMLLSCFILVYFFVAVSFDMQIAMDIRIFTLKYPIDHPKNRTSHKGVYINGLNNAQVLSKN